jgi:hypothetical protein
LAWPASCSAVDADGPVGESNALLVSLQLLDVTSNAMKARRLISCCTVAAALFWLTSPTHGGGLKVGGNTATDGYDPVTGFIYSEVRSSLSADFPGTTFVSLANLTGDLSNLDLIILNRFKANDLQLAEQTAIRNYVINGGHLLYVGEASGGVSNDSFTMPFGIGISPDPSTDTSLAFATYSNPSHPFMNGAFGMPSAPPSGSFAAQVATLGPSVELARWNGGGGVAISAFSQDALAPGAGFGLFLTDVNMVTPGRYSNEVGPVVSNALSVPEPSTGRVLVLGALAWLVRRRQSSSSRVAKGKFQGDTSFS